jgi:hypothetical protein
MSVCNCGAAIFNRYKSVDIGLGAVGAATMFFVSLFKITENLDSTFNVGVSGMIAAGSFVLLAEASRATRKAMWPGRVPLAAQAHGPGVAQVPVAQVPVAQP